MIKTATFNVDDSLRHSLYRSCGIILLLLVLIGSASAQDGTGSSTPSGLAPGAAAGSYALSDFDTVNVYNGNVNFHLPLLGVGGRGGAQMMLMLSMDNPKWNVSHTQNCPDCDMDTVVPRSSGSNYGFVGAGLFLVNKLGSGNVGWRTTLTRMKFIAADGTEYELRDKETYGAPKQGTEAFNRGHVFVSVDGAGMTFVSTDSTGTQYVDIYDNNSVGNSSGGAVNGYLMLPDGTRYWIQSTTGDNPYPQIRWVRDRNGNMLKFDYDDYNLVKITDSLNRVVNISYLLADTTITYKGFDGQERTIRIHRTPLSDYALRADYQTQDETHGVRTYGQLFPQLLEYWDNTNPRPAPDAYFNPTVIKEVILPDGRSYQLRYNRYGELARVEVPTGGVVEYNYTAGSGVIGPESGMDKEIYRRVKQRSLKVRRLLTDAETIEQSTTYSDPVVTGVDDDEMTVDTDPRTEVTVKNGAAQVAHNFYGDPIYFRNFRAPMSYGKWNEGREYETRVYTPNGLTMLRKVEHTWESGAPVGPRIQKTVTTLGDVTPNKVSQQLYGYDQYNNVTDLCEYDYGDANVGFLKRCTHTDYVTNRAIDGVVHDYDSVMPTPQETIHIRNLPAQQWVTADYVGSPNPAKVSTTTYEYDDYMGPNHAALVRYNPSIIGIDPDFENIYFKKRGNVTAITRKVSSSYAVTSYMQYDVAGNVVRSIDPEGHQTQFSYADNFGVPGGSAHGGTTKNSYAFVTAVTNALGQTTYTQYNSHTGKPVDVEDVNGVLTSMYYGNLTDDPLDRIKQVVRDPKESGTPNPARKSQTTFTYQDAIHSVISTSDLSAWGDNALKSETIYDGLGRTVETRSFETATVYIRVEQKYDSMGRASEVSNPYRPSSSATPLWTSTTHDALGRPTRVTRPDNSAVTSSYEGNMVTVMEANRDRKSTTDALGRLVEVVEDPGATAATLKYLTTYSYDPLDNLLSVTQGQQQRTFTYDWLSRLTSAENPESGKIEYKYDDNGNLIEKKDPRFVTGTTRLLVTYDYDELNRVKSKRYNNGGATPTVNYYYDDQTPPQGPIDFNYGARTGRLIAVTYSATGEGTYYGYDALGRVTRSFQKLGTQSYSMPEYKYDLAGNLTSEQYPTGRIIKTAYNSAGRISAVSETKAGVTTNYASSFGYAAHGAVEKLKLGNGLWEHTTYDALRLQPKEIGLGVSSLSSSLLKLSYEYGTPAQNNGNIQSQTIEVAGSGTQPPKLSVKQNYTYDAVNRLLTATEVNNLAGGQNWKQSYDYKNAANEGGQYGNRRIKEGTAYTSANVMPQVNPSISNLTNRIDADGYSYDEAGNMTAEPGHGYGYDGESRLVSFDAGTEHETRYSYDGEGRRVKKVIGVGSLAVTTTFVYDALGRVASEYETKTAGSEVGIKYLTQDHLGSTRIVTDVSKQVKGRYDYLPFGEEIGSSIGGRSTVGGYSLGDSTRQKFTGYQRDKETGLDYAQARYYASLQGRFISPDNFLNDTHVADPQSWNLYAYVRNNPLRYVDPDGRIKRDDKGNVIFEKTGSTIAEFGKGELQGKDGKTYTYSVTWKTDVGYVYADDGTKIEAAKATGEIKVTIKDSKGNTFMEGGKELAGEIYGTDGSNFSNVTDCHGTTFASGQVWIGNDQVEKLMKGDGYNVKNPTTAPKPNDVGIYSTDGKLSNTRHSVLVDSIDTKTGAVNKVISKGGITAKEVTLPGPGKGTAWPDPSVKLQYYTKKVTNK